MKSLTIETHLKQFLLLIFIVMVTSNIQSQVVIWSDNFNNGCASNCIASTWNGWTIQNNVGGTSGGSPNDWFVSCAEEGITPPGCGSSCIGDASLHIGADTGVGGDMGASYNETGANNATFKLAVSPTISTSGISTPVTLSFDFIAFGSAGCSDDRAQLRLSTDNGATWPAGFQYCLTSVCCGACNGYSQGQWTTYTLALPAAFNNNPNVRIGYHWLNNGNGSGTDPSVAIDDIRITTVVPLSLNLVDFYSKPSESATELHWKSMNETDFSHYDLERSEDGKIFSKIARIEGKGSPNVASSYRQNDVKISNKIVYYRLKMVDLNGEFSYSKIIDVDPNAQKTNSISIIHTEITQNQLDIILLSNKRDYVTYSLYNSLGKLIFSSKKEEINVGKNYSTMNLSDLETGIYILKATISGENITLSSKIRKN